MAREYSIEELEAASFKTIAACKRKCSWWATGRYERASIWKLPSGRFVATLEGDARGPFAMPSGTIKVMHRDQDSARWRGI